MAGEQAGERAGEGVAVSHEMFGPYRLDALLGRGGMGEVWRAYDTRRERDVALKRLRPGWADDAEFRSRFLREARTTARLASAHVVPIHDFGEFDGRLFIDMRLIRGGDLTARLADLPDGLDVAHAVDLMRQIAAGLGAAHAAGLVHRDVKPSNVLLEPGWVREFAYLVDFGIAKNAREAGTSLTAMGAMLGTPRYMAPELYDDAGTASVASDVYALGCVFHEMLTGRRPFTGSHPMALMAQHLHEPPPQPSARDRRLGPFDPVIARALAKDPAQRHPDAAAFADDAVRAASLAGVPGLAGPPGGTPAGPPSAAPTGPPSAAAAPTVVPGPAAAPAVSGPRFVDRPVPVEPGSARPGGGTGTGSGPHGSGSTAPPARPWWRRRGALVGAAALAVVLVVGVVTTVVATGGGEPAGPVGPPPLTAPTTIPVALKSPGSLKVSRDGRRAYVTNNAGTLTVLDTATHDVVATVPLPGTGTNELAVTPDGRRVYVTITGTNDAPGHTVAVVDTATNSVTATVTVGSEPFGIAASPDGRRVYVANSQCGSVPDDTVSVIDTASNTVVGSVPTAQGPCAIAASPDGTTVYVADLGDAQRKDGTTVTAIDTATTTTTSLPAGDFAPNTVVVSPDSRHVYLGAEGAPGTPGSVPVIDAVTHAVTRLPAGIAQGPYYVALTPDGATLVVANYGTDDVPARTAAIVDTATGRLRRLVPMPGQPYGATVTADGAEAWVTTLNPDELWRIPLP